ncbi:MAG: protein translocase subunit SecD [Planctomycetota bacterium]|nr:MAG: protein translocase subunit SecD [Planctomycetota bacterium]
MTPSFLLPFAQAAVEAAPAAAAAATAALPWWREGWGVWLLALSTVALPSLFAWLAAKQLRASDMWGRLAAVLTALVAGCVIIALGWPPRMGIDLKGGVILVYEIDSSKQSIVQEDVDPADGDTVAAAQRSAPVDMDKLVAAVSRRVNPGGQKEVTVRRFGLDQLEVIVPEVEQSEVELIKKIVSSAGVLEFRITANPDDPRHREVIDLAGRTPGETVINGQRSIGRWVQLDTAKMDPSENRGLVTRSRREGTVEVLVVLDRFDVTGGFLSRSSSSYDQNLQPCVNFAFNSAGASLFNVLTSQNLPDPANRLTSRLGIVLDGVLLSAPVIRSAISSSGQITGSFKQADVDFLVGVLNAGSLPAALYSEPISEQRISPQLGADTIRSGARAMLLATIVVLVFMLAYYRFAGFVADLAVVLNIILVVALMISIKAAFTLAGLAGLVLSVGMAVDANVLIYERMREETDRGAALRMAIRNGFQRAFSTILDSNLTTVITGLVLFAIGTDQLKGFAVTLILGLVLNLFTAVFCSRVMFDLAERNRWITRLNMARIFGVTNFRFVEWMRPAIVVSTLFILAGVATALQRGQGLFDIDFTGGTSVQVAFKPGQAPDLAAVREAVGTLPDSAVSEVTIEGVSEHRFKIDTSLRDIAQVQQMLQEVFPEKLATYAMAFDGLAEQPAVEGGATATTTATLDFPEKINQATLRDALDATLAAAGVGNVPFSIESPGMLARSKPYQTWNLTSGMDLETTRKVLERMSQQMADTPVYLSANLIGGKVAGNTKVTAVYALLASLLMIVLYVWLRFQNVAFGLAAVVALIHDVLVAVACLAMSHFVAPWMGWALIDDFKISLDVVAALLTIIGFSINDTIVIFDRLREIRGKSQFVTSEMVDKAVNQTLSRTILTSGTAFLATLILFLFGGSGIHAFAFTMLVGIITGTYSTIYIASPIVLWLQNWAGEPARVASSRAVRAG